MELVIQQIIKETNEAASFILTTTDGNPIIYKSGQFITLLFDTQFGEKRRSYSFSSSPDLHEATAITIKKIPNGEFSRKLVEHAKPGDLLRSSSVSGMFLLPAIHSKEQQYFFFAAGSGITPCYSMIKTLLYTTNNQVVLIYSNRSKEQTIFYNQLLELKESFKQRFEIRFLFSDLFDIYNSRLGKWLLPQLVEQYRKKDKADLLFYICGPWDFMQMVQLTLLSEHIPLHAIHKENFNTLPRINKPRPPDLEAHQVRIYANTGIHELMVQYPETILAAAKKSGIQIPYSCEAGRCGSCVATCTKGTVWMAYNEVLMDEEVAAGRFLCCQAYPVDGDIEVELS
ncbi:flavin reductase family protein [Flavihumibacter sp. UBA7668]|uniref:flavin reductase family protein n=1 Tax=Flavihumibacter sp. UBA7668 TaxID=1946542 RepID=UPI0025C4EA4D|nr:iron-sulfur cluster-binding domain-containing protein [Flavihumibacter sp. UBA7668]